jgi:PHP family Zn ribbon phosphoesterase
LFTSLAIEETKDGRKSMREFRRRVTEKPGKVNWSIIKTNEVYHNVFVHHRNSTPFERRMLELEEILEAVIHNIARESQTHRGLAE